MVAALLSSKVNVTKLASSKRLSDVEITQIPSLLCNCWYIWNLLMMMITKSNKTECKKRKKQIYFEIEQTYKQNTLNRLFKFTTFATLISRSYSNLIKNQAPRNDNQRSHRDANLKDPRDRKVKQSYLLRSDRHGRERAEERSNWKKQKKLKEERVWG